MKFFLRNKITYMKFYILCFYSCLISHIYSQQITTIQQIPELTPSLANLWGKAAIQNDVIGNDFFVDQRIGLNSSNRFHSDWDGWKPVDGFKRTLAGVADSIY